MVAGTAGPVIDAGTGDGKGGDMLIIPLLTRSIGERRPVGPATGGIEGVGCKGGAGGGPPLVELEKLDPVGWSTASALLDFPQSLRSRPSNIRRSMCKELVGGAIILKKEMVLVKSSLRTGSLT